MLDFLKDQALYDIKVKYISLHIVEYNNVGIKFYEKNGFTKG